MANYSVTLKSLQVFFSGIFFLLSVVRILCIRLPQFVCPIFNLQWFWGFPASLLGCFEQSGFDLKFCNQIVMLSVCFFYFCVFILLLWFLLFWFGFWGVFVWLVFYFGYHSSSSIRIYTLLTVLLQSTFTAWKECLMRDIKVMIVLSYSLWRFGDVRCLLFWAKSQQ